MPIDAMSDAIEGPIALAADQPRAPTAAASTRYGRQRRATRTPSCSSARPRMNASVTDATHQPTPSASAPRVLISGALTANHVTVCAMTVRKTIPGRFVAYRYPVADVEMG